MSGALLPYLANLPPRPNPRRRRAPSDYFTLEARLADSLGAPWARLGGASCVDGVRDILSRASGDLGPGLWLVRRVDPYWTSYRWAIDDGSLEDIPDPREGDSYPFGVVGLGGRQRQAPPTFVFAMPDAWEEGQRPIGLASAVVMFAPQQVTLDLFCAFLEQVAGDVDGIGLPADAALASARAAASPAGLTPDERAAHAALAAGAMRVLFAANRQAAVELNGGVRERARRAANVAQVCEAALAAPLDVGRQDGLSYRASVALLDMWEGEDPAGSRQAANSRLADVLRARVPYSAVLRGLLAARSGPAALAAYVGAPR